MTSPTGAVRGIYWDGVEVLRRVDYSVRDPQWGTCANRTTSESAESTSQVLRYFRRFDVGEGLFSGEFSCVGSAEGTLQLLLRLVAKMDVEVNRASFALLHPGLLCAGTPLRVTHTDGSVDETAFPTLMSPGQLAFDIAALRQTAGGVTADIAFVGEVFELEDQRNWTDASYKTYGRPLALPTPFAIPEGGVVEQSLTIAFSGNGRGVAMAGAERIVVGAPTDRGVPETMLALERGWEGPMPAGTPVLARIDLTQDDWQDELSSLISAAGGSLDLEAIVPDSAASIDGALVALRKHLDGHGAALRNLMALPIAYTRSYDPAGPWPSGATPEEALRLSRRHFPHVSIGGGMFTNFTELNRYRGSARIGDFVTHGTTAVVHTADDVGVMQTLEMLPQIFASDAAIAPGKPIRLGLCAIGMRSNPYASEVAPNPWLLRVAMAQADPRIRGLFGAAFMVGVVAATQDSAVASLALAAPGGPFGLSGGDGVYPAWHAVRGLARLSGQRRSSVATPAGVVAVAGQSAAGSALIVANISSEVRRAVLPEAAKIVVLDDLQTSANWLADAPRDVATTLLLQPFAIGFVSFGADCFTG